MAISFEEDLMQLLNRHSAEAPSGTPDFILAKMLTETVKTFNEAVSLRAQWRGETVEMSALTQVTEPVEDTPDLVLGIMKEELAKVTGSPRRDAREAQKLTDSIIPFSSADEGMDFPTKAKVILWDSIRETSNIQYDGIYIVWFAYVTGGWKAMLSTSAPDGAYYEVTFHKDNDQYYVDHYTKNHQTVFSA